jgi:hypothetical protein
MMPAWKVGYRKIAARLKAFFRSRRCVYRTFHEPEIRPDMEFVIPPRDYVVSLTCTSGGSGGSGSSSGSDRGRQLAYDVQRVHVYGRSLWIGDTFCKRCGKALQLDGSVTSYMVR